MVTLYDSYSETNQSSFDYVDAWTYRVSSAGQSFTGTGGVLDSVKFYIYKESGAVGNAYAKVYAHTGVYGTSSLPTGDALAISDALDISTLDTSFALETISFSGANKITLVSGTKYVIVLENTNSLGNTIRFGFDNTSPTHAGNKIVYNNQTSAWGAQSGNDSCFYVYVETSSESASPSQSPSTSESTSQSTSESTSPSTSSSVSPSPSPSPSVSESTSSSVSESTSSSVSESISPSVSESISPSVSESESPSVSESTSPSVSESQSASISPSVSESQSESTSPSVSESTSPSASPSAGYKNYTREAIGVLPTDDTDLSTNYSAQDIIDVATLDDVRVAMTGTSVFLIHQYKSFVSTEATCTVIWTGQTTLITTLGTVYLQLYNHDTTTWDTIDSENTVAANTDFTLTSAVADLTDYKDGSNVISVRVQQEGL